MDRVIVYPDQIPYDTDILNNAKSTMLAFGHLFLSVIGSGTCFSGLDVTQTGTPSMQVQVGGGSLFSLQTVDSSPYGTLGTDTAHNLMKAGVNIATTVLPTITAPGTSGQSQVFLVEAQFSETDTGPAVLQYYDPDDPTHTLTWSGPSNTGVSQNTLRIQRVLLQLKAGAAATTGTQVAPAVDAGWIGIAIVTVAFGQTTILNANIASYAGAAKIGAKLGSLNASFTTLVKLTGAGNFLVPPGVTRIRVNRCLGGGGAGPGGTGFGNGGGGGGGNARGYMTGLVPGATIAYSVGAAGVGSVGDGTSGGNTTFGGFTGGGGVGAGGSGFGPGGTASGGQINESGEPGYQNATTTLSNHGGGNALGQPGASGVTAGNGAPGQFPGTGGSSAFDSGHAGGNGAAGTIELEY